MAMKCFKHEVHSAQDQKFLRLFRDYGAEGYGTYWLIVECLYQLESPMADFPTIKTVIGSKCDENTLIAVLRNYGLFVESADGSTFYSPSILKDKERFKKASQLKSLGGSNGMKTRWNRQAPEREETPPPTDYPEQYAEESDMDYSEPSNQEVVIQKWNEIFEGTRQQYRGVALDHISFQRLKESLDAGYSVEELEEAFKIARNDSFTWLLKDVLKQDNIQRLLVRKEKEKEVKNDKQQRASFGADNFSSNGSSASIQSIDSIDWSEFEM